MRYGTSLLAALLLAGCAHHWPVREAIHPQPNRPYSQAVRVGRSYYFAGKIGVTDSTRALTTGRTAAETRNVLESFRALFAELGLTLGDVVQATVYLADMADYDEMNRVYAEYFPAGPPARETVAVSGIVSGARVEISFIAVRERR
ncbi:MAG TPA: Rid family hydrolase [Gemmatimonadales bacterium]|nr:Rid family hydrolase [Gemmatimonadales bacterium]